MFVSQLTNGVRIVFVSFHRHCANIHVQDYSQEKRAQETEKACNDKHDIDIVSR